MKVSHQRMLEYYERQAEYCRKRIKKEGAEAEVKSSHQEDATFRRRQDIWRHNSFFGHVAMGRKHMQAIAKSSTTTADAADLAHQIEALLVKLGEALKTRIDP